MDIALLSMVMCQSKTQIAAGKDNATLDSESRRIEAGKILE